MKRMWNVVTAASLVMITSCAAGMTVSSDFDPGTDFSSFRTYAWGTVDALPTGDPRLDNNPFFDRRVRDAIDRQLALKGFRRVAPDGADLLIHYHATVQERLDFYTVDREQGYESGRDMEVMEYEEETLLLDIVEAQTKQVIWRGWARANIRGVIDNREKMEALIEESARRLLELFPPPPTGR